VPGPKDIRYGPAAAWLAGLTFALAPAPGGAHPRCAVAQPYVEVAPAYRHVVEARPTISTVSRTETRWIGQMTLSVQSFRRWPRREARPSELAIDFDFSAEAGCEWFPTLFQRYFVLERSGDQFSMVAAYERRF
jgi:hypothetical protein